MLFMSYDVCSHKCVLHIFAYFIDFFLEHNFKFFSVLKRIVKSFFLYIMLKKYRNFIFYQLNVILV